MINTNEVDYATRELPPEQEYLPEQHAIRYPVAYRTVYLGANAEYLPAEHALRTRLF